LLIVPFKTKILQYNIFKPVITRAKPKGKHCYYDAQMNTGLSKMQTEYT